jgi:hypothetical protein
MHRNQKGHTMTDPIKQAIEALQTAKNGLEWYRDAYPGGVNGSDDEADAEIAAAITALEKLAQSGPVGVVQHLHELNDAWLSRLPIGTKLFAHSAPKDTQ